jgi:hypothetical protein
MSRYHKDYQLLDYSKINDHLFFKEFVEHNHIKSILCVSSKFITHEINDVEQYNVILHENTDISNMKSADMLYCVNSLEYLSTEKIISFLKIAATYKYCIISYALGNNLGRKTGPLDTLLYPFYFNGIDVSKVSDTHTILYKRPEPININTYIPKVLLAVHSKDSSGLLDLYIKCVENLDYPKNRIHLYIRTNNNKDNTSEILLNWANKCRGIYADVEIDTSNVEQNIEKYDRHEWNAERFSVLGKIRQASLKRTLETDCDFYFVIDSDNYILPHTLRNLVDLNLPIVAPLLRKILPNGFEDPYANLHYACDDNGYYKNHPMYDLVINRTVKGIFEVSVVHCTYLIRRSEIEKLTYCDGTSHYEYVIFSNSARKNGIKQYIDNRTPYGGVIFESDSSQVVYLNSVFS